MPGAQRITVISEPEIPRSVCDLELSCKETMRSEVEGVAVGRGWVSESNLAQETASPANTSEAIDWADEKLSIWGSCQLGPGYPAGFSGENQTLTPAELGD